MSLFGSLQTASNTLQAMQIGLQVVGNNIANANTEGFIREQVNYAPAPVQRRGGLNIGLGVVVDSITQKIDDFLGNQLRDASADRAAADIQNEAYKDLEALLGELTNNDLSTGLTKFFGAIENTNNATAGDPYSSRNLAVLEGERLAGEIRRIDQRAKALRDNYDNEIATSVGQVNQLALEIQQFNIRITQTEAGSVGSSDAGALRTQRNNKLNALADLIDATVVEQPSGGLSIAVGGEFLVFEGQRREISLEVADGTGEAESRLVFTDSGKRLDLASGRIYGLTQSRDTVVDGFRDQLDGFAKSLINEFNKVYSQGQGLVGFDTLTTQEAVLDPNAALDAAGLTFSPTNGEFRLDVANTNTGVITPTWITIDLLGTSGDPKTTLADLAEQLDNVTGISASINVNGRLTLASETSDTRFTFAEDTSGVLASLGLNSFFTGSGSSNIGTNRELSGIANAGKFALSRDGVEGRNAIALAALADQPLASLDGASIYDQYDQMVNELSQRSTVAGSIADGLGAFESTLESEFQSISGVNIDEEAIDMISLQRIYQATARYISVVQAMLDALVAI
ncbi:flagellar hook-associated protein FlgK [Botrimarina hoheduenensis]|uniref:Flagellar hook-associated protein 1 n=1 Tax=Botrimarina hoheduenensis TaxID=2528000 RepID=A0A5C5VYV2_9BACT|nr:flagellar hook-associated protein FlgK [Botrimarina hoheduenensis]TWT42692.1 Flagellar hook-associated protein 1 [Botrimarina hoheduenensis]